MFIFIYPSIIPSLLRNNVSDPLEVGRVALVNRQADDLGHFVRVVRAKRGADKQLWFDREHSSKQNILRAVITVDSVAVGWNIMLFLGMNSPDIFSKSGNFGTSGFNHLHRRHNRSSEQEFISVYYIQFSQHHPPGFTTSSTTAVAENAWFWGNFWHLMTTNCSKKSSDLWLKTFTCGCFQIHSLRTKSKVLRCRKQWEVDLIHEPLPLWFCLDYYN